MANKKNEKKATQKHAASTASASSATKATKKVAKADPKAAKAAKSKAKSKAKKSESTIFGGIARYFGAVRTEMRRVTWPSKKELRNFTVVVCASLIVVGIVIAALDFVIGEGLFLVSGLRG